MKAYRERKPDKTFHHGAKKEWEGIVKVVCTHTYLVPYVVSGKDKDEAMKNTKKRMSDRGRRPRGVQTRLLYTSPSPRDGLLSRMPSSA